MVRCFIGFLIPENLKNKIISIQNGLKELPMSCKFVEPENLHISFSFLGEVDENRIEEMGSSLDDIVKNYEKIPCRILGLKPIPSRSYIRVLALDVMDEHNNLREIGNVIRKEMGGDVKPPHLTLCRVRRIDDKIKVLEGIDRYNELSIDIVIDRIQLIKSELRGDGPIYKVIHESIF